MFACKGKTWVTIHVKPGQLIHSHSRVTVDSRYAYDRWGREYQTGSL